MLPADALSVAPALEPGAALDPAEVVLARLARLAANAFGVPLAQAVRYGAGGDGEAPKPISHGTLGGGVPDLRLACAALPADAALVVVQDAAKDARLVGVLPPAARFFVLAALEGADGGAHGALCLLDERPREWSALHGEALLDLAAHTADLLGAEARHTAAQASLAEAEARFQALDEAVDVALFVLEDGVVLDANARALSLLGHAHLDDVAGRLLTGLADPAHAPTLDALGASASPAPCEVTLRHAGGEAVPVRMRACPFPYEGRVLRFLVASPLGAA
ncbi:MAG TPA: PAS domain-containing protein [Rubricoccaceae bacterium]|nr:PAS domain-containing protein [Rubricoccaceae bacterium]